MNVYINRITKDKTLFYSFTGSIGFLMVTSIFLFFSYRNLPPLLPLFNQMPWGETKLGTKLQLLLPLALSTGIFFLNIILAEIYYIKIPLIARVAAITSLLCSALVFLFTIRTILLVI